MGVRYCQQNIVPVTWEVGAQLATMPYPNSGTRTTPFTSGSVTIKAMPGSSLNLSNWSDLIPFDAPGPDIAFNGDENFELDLAEPVHSLAFEYDLAVPEQPAFKVDFYLGTLPVGSHENFRALRYFSQEGPFNCFAWWLDEPFDRVVFTEQDDLGDNEYFGRIFTGTQAPPASKLWPTQGEGNFGWSLVAEGNLLAVGALQSAVDIYRIGRQGELPALVTHLPLMLGNVKSAADLDIDGQRVAIGNAGPDLASPGSALVASPDTDGFYTQVATLAAPSSNDLGFGAAVAISDPYLVVGAPDTPSGDGLVAGEGKAFVYQRSGAAWNLKATLESPAPNQGRHFGTDVEIQGDELFVSADGPATQGAGGSVFLYKRSGSSWLPAGELVIPGSPTSVIQAGRVSVEGDVLAASAIGYNSDDFCCYFVAVYSRDGGGWSFDTELVPDNSIGFPFGTRNAMVVKGGHVFLGQNSPWAFDFAMQGKSCSEEFAPDGAGGWVAVAHQTNFMTLRTDECGSGLAVSDHFVFAGAPQDSHDTGVGIDFAGRSNGSGSVAVFQRSIFWDGFDQ